MFKNRFLKNNTHTQKHVVVVFVIFCCVNNPSMADFKLQYDMAEKRVGRDAALSSSGLF